MPENVEENKVLERAQTAALSLDEEWENRIYSLATC
jgi:hypothetical protein